MLDVNLVKAVNKSNQDNRKPTLWGRITGANASLEKQRDRELELQKARAEHGTDEGSIKKAAIEANLRSQEIASNHNIESKRLANENIANKRSYKMDRAQLRSNANADKRKDMIQANIHGRQFIKNKMEQSKNYSLYFDVETRQFGFTETMGNIASSRKAMAGIGAGIGGLATGAIARATARRKAREEGASKEEIRKAGRKAMFKGAAAGAVGGAALGAAGATAKLGYDRGKASGEGFMKGMGSQLRSDKERAKGSLENLRGRIEELRKKKPTSDPQD